MPLIRLGFSLMAAIAGGSSCGLGRSTGQATPTGACSEVLTCPTGLSCREEACVGETGTDHPVTLRIRPAPGRSLAAVELSGLEVSDPVFELPAPIPLPFEVPLYGQVLDPAGRSEPAARVVALPEGGLSDTPLVVQGERSAENPGLFSLAIAPWWPTPAGMRSLISYRLRLALPALPPWEAALRWGQVEPLFVIEIPRGDAVIRLPGVLRLGGGNPLPLAGVRVVAFAGESNRPLSSESTTDALGRFELLFWPTGEARTVRVRTLSTEVDRPLPTVERLAEVPAAGVGEFLELEVGDLPRLFQGSIQVMSEGRPLPGAEIRLEAAVGAGVFTTRGRADAQGRLQLPIYPGQYLIDVVASLDDPTRVTRVQRSLSPAAPEAVVAPLNRTPVGGQILDAAGQPVAAARVEAELLSATYGDPGVERPGESPPPRRQLTETEEDGSFLLTLDPGRHALFITPGRGLPSHRVEFSFAGEQPRTLDPMVLPAAVVLKARLVDEDGAVVPNALVEAWSASDPPVKWTSARSGADGSVRLRVPATR